MSEQRATSRRSPRPAKAVSNRRAGSARKPPVTRTGVVVTSELAEKLADEAEAGYDLSRGRRVGRPSLGGPVGSSPRVNFRTTPHLHEQAQRRAKREGKTISQVAREALEKYVA
jgi:hypothetical protein